jgi:hypothetical protein
MNSIKIISGIIKFIWVPFCRGDKNYFSVSISPNMTDEKYVYIQVYELQTLKYINFSLSVTDYWQITQRHSFLTIFNFNFEILLLFLMFKWLVRISDKKVWFFERFTSNEMIYVWADITKWVTRRQLEGRGAEGVRVGLVLCWGWGWEMNLMSSWGRKGLINSWLEV